MGKIWFPRLIVVHFPAKRQRSASEAPAKRQPAAAIGYPLRGVAAAGVPRGAHITNCRRPLQAMTRPTGLEPSGSEPIEEVTAMRQRRGKVLTVMRLIVYERKRKG